MSSRSTVRVGEATSVDEALVLMRGSRQSAGVVVNSAGDIVGSIVDSDLRRAVLGGKPRNTSVGDLMRALGEPIPRASTRAVAVVMAGGRGERLRPLTDDLPKALLTLGGSTILDRLLHQLSAAGIVDVYLSVHYKAELIEARVGDGSRYDLNVKYLHEERPLHTAGVLSLLPPPLQGPLLVVNAKLVTSLPMSRALDFFAHEQPAILVGAMEYEVGIPYGVLRLDDLAISAIDEKPRLSQWCNAGLYVLAPSVLDLVPTDVYFGMPDLITAVLEAGHRVLAFPILEKIISISTRQELDDALLYFATGADV